MGLKSDGTVTAVGENEDGQCDVADWNDIVAVFADCRYTMGLKSDGTVVAVGDNEWGQCDVGSWKDIVAVSIGGDDCHNYTIGLKSDGTVVAVGCNENGQCDVTDWDDIVAVSAGIEQTVGLKSDGTVVAVGCNGKGQCSVDGWKLFGSLETLEQERTEARKCAEKARKREKEEYARRLAEKKAAIERTLMSLQQEKESLQIELANLRGLFTGKRRRQIEERIGLIDAKQKALERENK